MDRELTDKLCPICGGTIVSQNLLGGYVWVNRHLPYISFEEGKIKAGYICPKSIKEPVIIYSISLKEPGQNTATTNP